MQDVNIYIETSFHGPARKDGEYIYLLECVRNGVPATREGRGAMERATENQLALTALAEALGRLNCPCELRIYTTCQHIINAMQNSWARQWQKRMEECQGNARKERGPLGENPSGTGSAPISVYG